ncbi:hypothetical protein ACGFSI_24270 [Streptomyces virginiae]|uniref:hypothetical protein n=1 Tax=Streptomyces virginiae TaxID=1961 RepID=UPI00371438CF
MEGQLSHVRTGLKLTMPVCMAGLFVFAEGEVFLAIGVALVNGWAGTGLTPSG